MTSTDWTTIAALASVLGCATHSAETEEASTVGEVLDAAVPDVFTPVDDSTVGRDDVGVEIVEVPPKRPELPTDAERWCADYDRDGYSDPLDCIWILPRENAPAGHVRATPPWDCMDAEATTFPGAAELESLTACMADHDDDGYGYDRPSDDAIVPGIDCDDYDHAVYLGSSEHEPTLCAADRDDDGYGAPVRPVASWWLDVGTDCDDANDAAFPGAAEKEAKDPSACRIDHDEDGYGDTSMGPTPRWWLPSGAPGLVPGTDCDDEDPFSFPGSAEKDMAPYACCRDADLDGYGDRAPLNLSVDAGDDCDDEDPNVGTCATWCVDADGDGLGEYDCMKVLADQVPPSGWVVIEDYCFTKDDELTSCPSWCVDGDGDGLGSTSCTEVLPGQEPPLETVGNADDCDDADADCFCVQLGPNGGGYPWEQIVCAYDSDGDGHPGRPLGYDAKPSYGFDCNDWSDCTYPGAAEKEDSSSCMSDCDGDGFGDWFDYPSALGGKTWQTGGKDCDDGSASTFPGAAEKEPQYSSECHRDDDGDGFGDRDVDPNGFVAAGTDCDDDDAAVSPTLDAEGGWTCAP